MLNDINVLTFSIAQLLHQHLMSRKDSFDKAGMMHAAGAIGNNTMFDGIRSIRIIAGNIFKRSADRSRSMDITIM